MPNDTTPQATTAFHTSPPHAPAWDAPRLQNPHTQPDKPERVRSMFAAIAPSYDLNNRLHSLWRDQAWRRYAIRQARVQPGDTALDIACGTGDLCELLAKSPAARVIGIDLTSEMLDVARKRQARLAPELAAKITYQQGDAQSLPLDTASFDVLTIAFGIRNVLDPRRALAEFARVLKPGGRLVILEFDRPRFPPIRWFNDFYCAKVMPITATLISGDRSGAYKYLPKSVATFMPRADLEQAITAAGFKDTTSRPLSLGICVCYSATRA